MSNFPLKKDYTLHIKLELDNFGNKEVINKKLEYSQATILETNSELDAIDSKGMDIYFLDFLKNNSDVTEEDLTLMSFSEWFIDNLLKTFLSTRFKGVISQSSLEWKNDTGELKPKGGVPFSAMLTLLSEKLSIDPLSFQERYTFEQMHFLMEGIEYWVNAQTEEWQKKNKAKYEKDPEYDAMLLAKLSMIP